MVQGSGNIMRSTSFVSQSFAGQMFDQREFLGCSRRHPTQRGQQQGSDIQVSHSKVVEWKTIIWQEGRGLRVSPENRESSEACCSAPPIICFEGWVEFVAETSLTWVTEIQVRGRKTLVDRLRSKDEEIPAVNLFALLRHWASCSVSGQIDTSQGSLLLSCGDFLYFPEGFRNLYFHLWLIVTAISRHKYKKSTRKWTTHIHTPKTFPPLSANWA